MSIAPLGSPLISVVIPVYNRGDVLAATLQSLGDLGNRAEVIIVDDGSTDDSDACARRLATELFGDAATVVSQPNGGPGAARNAGAAIARGAYLAFLDSDDLWSPHTVDALVGALEDAAPAMLFSATRDVVDGEALAWPENCTTAVHSFPDFLSAVASGLRTRFGSCNATIRRDVFTDIGGFVTDIRCSEDTDLFLRASSRGSCVVLDGAPFVAHVVGRNDHLTGDFEQVATGFDHLQRARARGEYSEGASPGALDRFFAQCAVHTIRAAFAAGNTVEAYRMMSRNAGLLVRARNWHWIARLPVYPLLGRLKPSSFPVGTAV